MMSNKGNDEPLLQCPYNKAHLILKHRMQVHLVKCARNYPDVKIATCTFNATHRVPEPELKYHASVCPDRINLDKAVFKPDNVKGADVLFPIPKLNVQPTECWDNLEEVPTYNPEEHCKNNPILRNNIHTKSAATRRNFRNEERARLQQFEHKKPLEQNQLPGLEIMQKQRRPAVKSAGIPNDKDLDICDIMKEIAINATVLTTPKVPVVETHKPQEARKPDLDEKEFPSLNNELGSPKFKAAAPWSASGLAMRDTATSNVPPTKHSLGRGSFLAKKN